MEITFTCYRTYQTQIGAGDWDLTTGAKPLTPDKDDRLIFALVSIVGYISIIAIYLLAKTKFQALYNVICGMLVANLLLY